MEIRKIEHPSNFQNKFIGAVFKRECSYLEVTGVYKKGVNTLFSVECSKCSKDKELFPESEMLISKNNIKQGKSPCRCSAGWKPSFNQYKTLVGRFCKEVGDSSANLLEDLQVTVVTEGYGEWKCHVTQYLQGKRSNRESYDTRNKNIRFSDEAYSEKFMESGCFIEGTRFWRSSRKDSRGYSVYWEYYCPVCSKDEYVRKGLCSGVFEGCSSTLKNGNRSCRCVKTFRWTQEQREYQLKSICDKDGITFLGWNEDYKGAFTKFRWRCAEGHDNFTETSNFLHLNHRCSTCSEGLWGLYKNRLYDKDNLYLIKLYNRSENFVKVGRSFKLKDRLKYFKKFYKVEVISTIEDIHENIYRVELNFKNKLKSQGFLYSPEIPFDGSLLECFTSEILSHPEIISTFNLSK